MTAARASSDPRDRLVVELPARTGMRAGELADLEADAVVQIGAGHWLRIPLGKLRNDRYVPLHPELVTLVGAWTAASLEHTRRHKRLIADHRGPLDRYVIGRIVARAAGVPGVHPHRLRHTLATQAINRMRLEAIAALLGHRKMEMTLIYAKIANRVVADEYAAASASIDALYGQPPALPADYETTGMARLRGEAHARMLGNGLCTRPAELDCRMESACEPAPTSAPAPSSCPSSPASPTTPATTASTTGQNSSPRSSRTSTKPLDNYHPYNAEFVRLSVRDHDASAERRSASPGRRICARPLTKRSATGVAAGSGCEGNPGRRQRRSPGHLLLHQRLRPAGHHPEHQRLLTPRHRRQYLHPRRLVFLHRTHPHPGLLPQLKRRLAILDRKPRLRRLQRRRASRLDHSSRPGRGHRAQLRPRPRRHRQPHHHQLHHDHRNTSSRKPPRPRRRAGSRPSPQNRSSPRRQARQHPRANRSPRASKDPARLTAQIDLVCRLLAVAVTKEMRRAPRLRPRCPPHAVWSGNGARFALPVTCRSRWPSGRPQGPPPAC
jgi:hypothetical protein